MVYIHVKSGHKRKRAYDRLVSLNNFVNKELRSKSDGGIHDFRHWSESKTEKELGSSRNGMKMKERNEMMVDLKKKEIIK